MFKCFSRFDSSDLGRIFSCREDERAKELRKLKKKLRQIEEIEANVASGKLTNPTAEQRAKLEQKAALLSEIAALESQP